ncbi:MAG: hypothetical protein AMJ56_14460 [Anaerolineae bacterium SG8_19]|nr:MAG: hypothetical protein AMJ56_14460 [Anaerolineae bacterium SG8_19]
MTNIDTARYDTQILWRQDRDHYIHPWTDFEDFKEKGSLVMAEGEGVYVYDSDGKRYIDGNGGLWCVNLGYGNKELAQTMYDQALRLPYYTPFINNTTPPAAELAAKLAEIAPGPINHVFYGTGGSVANDTAVRIIHFYFNRIGKPNKKKIISRLLGYHGSTFMAMTLTGIPSNHEDFDLAPDLVHYISTPYPYRRPDGMSLEAYCDFLVEELENKILELGPENVAAFIAEPILGAGGVIVPPPGYQRRTLEVCRKYDIFYISDEVVTGFGRLGHFLASESVFDIVPDVITCAKGMSSAYIPLGATLISDEIYEVISQPRGINMYFSHGFTYSGHAVSCAVGLKTIEILERDGILEHVRQVGPYFVEQLKSLEALGIVGEVRGNHLMVGIECVANKETKDLLPDEVQIARRIAAYSRQKGLIIRPLLHLLILSPPLIITKEQIDTVTQILHESIKATMDDLVREGIWSGN